MTVLISPIGRLQSLFIEIFQTDCHLICGSYQTRISNINTFHINSSTYASNVEEIPSVAVGMVTTGTCAPNILRSMRCCSTEPPPLPVVEGVGTETEVGIVCSNCSNGSFAMPSNVSVRGSTICGVFG